MDLILRRILISLTVLYSSVWGSDELEVLAADGRKYDMSGFPNMLVTEFIKGRALKIEDGRFT